MVWQRSSQRGQRKSHSGKEKNPTVQTAKQKKPTRHERETSSRKPCSDSRMSWHAVRSGFINRVFGIYKTTDTSSACLRGIRCPELHFQQHRGHLSTTHHGLLLRFQLRLRERHLHMRRQVRVLRLLHVLVRELLVLLQPRLRGVQEVERFSPDSREKSRGKPRSARARRRARERCFRRGPSERVRPCHHRDVHDGTAPIV